MKVQTYLTNLLQGAGEYSLTEQDLKLINKVGLQDFITAKLYSKKYRKWKLDEQSIKLVTREVDEALRKGRPIEVFFAQGSYKLWRVASAPRANWAEFFNLAYLVSYLAPIAAAYKHGVSLTYYFLTVLPQTHNNLSETEVISYLESFQDLIDRYEEYLPGNINIKIERDMDAYSRRKYNNLLKKALLSADKKFYKWPKPKQDDYIRRARLNIKWDGVEDWTQLSDEQKERQVERAVLYEYAATQVILEKDKERRGVILSTLPKEDSIGVGSTSTSIAKHWVGEGVLEESGGVFYPRILSPSQYEYAMGIKHKSIKTKIIPGDIFAEIEVYPRHFDFSQK
ncbi:MAG: hypothetical protein UX62_C0046G0014 [Microgenomates group bacterium GW2011_GWA2_46_7]|nr:MAG: hypothetical protein UX62_C0046G0014 [Microgenomates group bacterium GW2011_GWA2_46_7]